MIVPLAVAGAESAQIYGAFRFVLGGISGIQRPGAGYRLNREVDGFLGGGDREVHLRSGLDVPCAVDIGRSGGGGSRCSLCAA
ncbi:hypothetical protein D3C76_1590280 [compost metagenome]